jgi:ribosomal protein L35
MKQKTCSALKKRVKVRKSGSISVQKAAKRHLLINKSKKQKKSHSNGMPVCRTKMTAIKRLLPGKVRSQPVPKKKVKAKAA